MAVTSERNVTPDFFALLRSPPSAIDALDTLYEPNAVFTQFIGPASMVFFFLSFPCCLFNQAQRRQRHHIITTADTASVTPSCTIQRQQNTASKHRPITACLFFSFLFFLPFFFRFFFFLFASFFFFLSFFPNDSSLTFVCVVRGATCNLGHFLCSRICQSKTAFFD